MLMAHGHTPRDLRHAARAPCPHTVRVLRSNPDPQDLDFSRLPTLFSLCLSLSASHYQHTHTQRSYLSAGSPSKSPRNIPPMPCCLHILNLSRPLGHPHYPLPLRFLVHTTRRSPHTQPPQICALALGHARRHWSRHSYAAPRCPLAAHPAPAPRVAWWFEKRRFHPQRKNEKEFG